METPISQQVRIDPRMLSAMPRHCPAPADRWAVHKTSISLLCLASKGTHAPYSIYHHPPLSSGAYSLMRSNSSRVSCLSLLLACAIKQGAAAPQNASTSC